MSDQNGADATRARRRKGPGSHAPPRKPPAEPTPTDRSADVTLDSPGSPRPVAPHPHSSADRANADTVDRAGALDRKPAQATPTGPAPDAEASGSGRLSLPSNPEAGVKRVSRFPDAPCVGDLVGDCRILSVLGEGGMGVVYKAVRRMLKRVVALKVLPPSIRRRDPRFVKRFLFEAQSAARLNHPNVVSVYNVGDDKGVAFIETEYVSGRPVSRLLRRGPLSRSEARRVMKATASALSYAHGFGLIHRDVKPGNILVSRTGEVMLADFGLAGPVTHAATGAPEPPPAVGDAAPSDGRIDRITEAGALLGTPGYMAPEQIRGESLDQRADVYALGVTLFVLITGSMPFDAANTNDLLARCQHEPLPDPNTRNPRAGRTIARVVARATAIDRDDRYPSCDAMIHDLCPPRQSPTDTAPADPQAKEFWDTLSDLVRGVRDPDEI